MFENSPNFHSAGDRQSIMQHPQKTFITLIWSRSASNENLKKKETKSLGYWIFTEHSTGTQYTPGTAATLKLLKQSLQVLFYISYVLGFLCVLFLLSGYEQVWPLKDMPN